MQTSRMTLESLTRLLQSQGVDQARLEALVLIEKISRIPRAKVVAGDFKLSAAAAKRIRKLALKRRRLPLAYITKRKEFRSLNFYVDRRVLIPRPESEALIEAALALRTTFKKVYDLGCGSGCLAISYLKAVPDLQLQAILVDSSRGALRVATKNCRRQGVMNATLDHRDILQLPPSFFDPGSLILANLPYLDIERRTAYEQLSPILKAEPATSLYCRRGGLELYQHLLTNCSGQNLTIVCETLEGEASKLAKLAASKGFDLSERRGLASVFVPSKRS